ncbi:MAG: amino acid adenylation protein, partial [Ilumatobacteraceae bacterium]|nr:amino acid adenylation protein [Ilumatobacteraceae bacterium]
PSAWLAVAGAGPVPAEILAVLDELGVDARATVDDWPSTSDPPSSDVDIGRPDVDIGVVGVGVVGVDIDISAVDTAPVEIGPDDVACLTFTSGSTGTPKAVIGRHGSLTHFLPWQTERFGITSTDRFSMLSGLAHDPLQRDMFWPLWVGATLVVPDPEEIPTPGWLAEWFRREQITVSHLTPAMGRLFTEHAYPGAARQLRKAFFIGDVLPRRDVERLREVAPGVEVVNLYGTTETQRASAHHVVGDDDLAGHDGAEPLEILPLGTGIPGTQVLVRSASGSPAGFGEIGEIWVRSHHLAAGYLDRPEETAERFLDLAAPGGPGGAAGSGMPGDRAYRTGDRGRYRWDGAVEHRGRADGQVQLRGFRIETAEVRDWLLRLDDVGDAAVVVRDDLAAGTGDQRLVAYVVPATHRDIDPVALRTSLRTSLPTNMVPNDIVVLERLPLTPNGKLDRAALPAPDGRLPLGGGRPCDEVEERLAGWFGQVLGRHDVGVHDNFFDLGGYSLLATRLFAIIESETGRRIPVATLFQAPTVATLATIIRSGVSDGGWSSLVPIQPGGSQIPFFYVTPYMISVLQLAHLAVELGADQPLYGLQPQGLDGSLAIHTRIEEMAAHYIDEMKSVQPRGPYRIGGHCSGAWVAFEIARQLEAADDEIAAIVLVDQGPPAIQRSIPSLPRYFASRARFYLSDRRLMPAVRWQLKIVVNRLLMRRIASRANRFTEEVKITHRHAYGKYAGGTVDHDIVLIRSQESIALPDKTWYLRWGEMTTGSMRHTWSSGTHANLLERPYVEMLADRLRWAFDPGVSEAADV